MAGAESTTDSRAAYRVPAKGVLLAYRKSGLLARLRGGEESRPLPVRNISRDGLCFLCHERLKPGQKLVLSVRLGPRRPTIRTQGEVRWRGEGSGIYEYRVGVRFTDVAPGDWHILSQVEKYVLKPEDWSLWRFRSRERASKPFGEP